MYKKISNLVTLILSILVFSAFSANAQAVSQSGILDSTTWVVSGVYNSASLIENPQVTNGFTFDDNAGGPSSVDSINADYAIDISGSRAASEDYISVSYKYAYRNVSADEKLKIQMFNADSSRYVDVATISPNMSSPGNYATTASSNPLDSVVIDVSSLSANALANFGIRITYFDASLQSWGFSFKEMSIRSLGCSVFVSDASQLNFLDVTDASVRVYYDISSGQTSGTGVIDVDLDTSITFSNPITMQFSVNDTVTFNGLLEQEDYFARVRFSCGAGSASAYSTSTSSEFKTLCAPIVLPIFENLDEIIFPGTSTSLAFTSQNFPCWSSSGTSSFSNISLRSAPQSPTSSTFRSQSYSPDNYIRMNFSSFSDRNEVFMLPSTNMIPGNDYVLQFKYFTQGPFSYEIKFGSGEDAQFYRNSGQILSTAQVTGSSFDTADFKNRYVRFTYPSTAPSSPVNIAVRLFEPANTDYSYLSIDDVELYEAPECDVPQVSLDSVYKRFVRIKFLEIPSVQNYIVRYAPVNSNLANGDTIHIAQMGTNDTFRLFSFTKNLNTGTSYNLIVQSVCSSTSSSVFSDTVKFTTQPSCIAPQNVSFSASRTDATVLFSDVDNISSDDFEHEYGSPTQPLGLGTRTIFTTTNDSSFIPGPLMPETVYAYYLRKICAAGDTSEFIGPVFFKTECDFVSFPYSQGFESIGGLSSDDKTVNGDKAVPECFKAISFNTSRVEQPTYFAAHYDSLNASRYPRTGNKYVSVRWSSRNYIMLPSMNFRTDRVYKFSAYYTNDGRDGFTGALRLDSNGTTDVNTFVQNRDFSGSDPLTVTELGTFVFTPHPNSSISFDVQNEYQKIELSFQTQIAGPKTLCLYTEAAFNPYYLSIDDILVEELPLCANPNISDVVFTNALGTSISMTFTNPTAGSTPTRYEISYDSSSTAMPGSGTLLSTVDTTLVINGLTPQKDYTYFIRSFCGTDSSAWTSTSTFNSGCLVVTTLPYSYGFETHPDLDSTNRTTSIPPECYRVFNADAFGGGYEFRTEPGDYGRRSRTDSGYVSISYSNESYLILPAIQLDSGISYDVSFYYTHDGASSGYDYSMIYSNSVDSITSGNGNVFDQGDFNGKFANSTGALGTNPFLKHRTSFVSPKTGVYYIAIFMDLSFSPWYFNMDDILVRRTPNCQNNVSNILASDITTNAMKVSWDDTTTGITDYVYAYRVSGTNTFISSGIVTNDADSVNITGLQPTTTYDIFIRPICGANDTAEYSEDPNIAAMTKCVLKIPYLNSIETDIFCYENATDDVIDWDEDSGGTPSGNTGPSAASNGTQYFYLEASNRSEGDSAVMITPTFTLDTSRAFSFDFDYHMYGSNMGTLKLYYKEPTSNVWKLIFEKSGDQGNNWITEKVSQLNGNLTDTAVQFRFVGIRGDGFRSDIAIDNISMDYLPSCYVPFSITENAVTHNSVQYDFQTLLTTGNLEVKYDTIGASFTDARFSLSIPNSDGAININGLNISTNYVLYIRTVCGPNDASTDTFRTTFTTKCLDMLPYYMSFENNQSVGIACFSDINATGSGLKFELRTGPTPTSGTGPSSASSGNSYMYIESSLSSSLDSATLQTSAIVLDMSRNPYLSVDYHMYGSSTGAFKISIESPAYSGNWVNMLSENGNKGDMWNEFRSLLSDYIPTTTDTIRLRFIAEDPAGPAFSDIAIDNIVLEYAPPCPNPYAVSVSRDRWTNNSVMATWNSFTGLVPSFQYSIDTVGKVPTNTTFGVISGTTTSNQVMPNLLSSNTEYDLFVRATCSNDTSRWIGPVNFKTLCLDTMGYTETFESTSVPECMFDFNGETVLRYRLNQGSTPSFSTGPSSAYQGSGYIHVEGSDISSLDTMLITTPVIALDVSSSPYLHYAYHMQGAGFGLFQVVMENPVGSGNWTVLDSLRGDQGPDWHPKRLYMSNYLTGLQNNRVRFGFMMTEATGIASDLAIDTVGVYASPLADVELSQFNISGLNLSCSSVDTVGVSLTVTNTSGSVITAGTTIPYSFVKTLFGNVGAIDIENRSMTLASDLAVGQTVDDYFIDTLRISGNYVFGLNLNLPNDEIENNDSLTVTGTFQKYLPMSMMPYTETFADPNNTLWYIDGVNSQRNSFEIGTPTVDGGPTKFVGTDNRVLATNLDGDHNTSEKSYLVSPCFDLSANCFSEISFDLWNDTESTYDGTNLEISIAGGAWVTLGSADDDDWYNESAVSGLRQAGFSLANDTNWTRYTHRLTTGSSISELRVRIAFGSDGSTQRKGIAIDNIRISTGVTVSNGSAKDTLICGDPNDLKLNPVILNFSSVETDSIFWNNGDITPRVNIDTTGQYILNLHTRLNPNCVFRDTFNLLNIDTPITNTNIINDTVNCGDVDLELPFLYGNSASNSAWGVVGNSTPIASGSNFNVTTTGRYFVSVDNICVSFTDTFEVTINDIPEVTINADKLVLNELTDTTTAIYTNQSNTLRHSWSHTSLADSSFLLTKDILELFGGQRINKIFVEVFGLNGCSGSDTITITYSKSLNNITSGSIPVDIYPNPSKDVFTVKFDAREYNKTIIKVVDLLGRELLRKDVTSSSNYVTTSLDLTGYTEGMYLMIIETDKGYIVNKLTLVGN